MSQTLLDVPAFGGCCATLPISVTAPLFLNILDPPLIGTAIFGKYHIPTEYLTIIWFTMLVNINQSFNSKNVLKMQNLNVYIKEPHFVMSRNDAQDTKTSKQKAITISK